jgi:hypothetical protein
MITSSCHKDVVRGIIATSTADAMIAANSGFFIPNARVTLPEKYDAPRFASDAAVRMTPTSKMESVRLPNANNGMPVEYMPERRNAKPNVAIPAELR